jgi:hypothetical protein
MRLISTTPPFVRGRGERVRPHSRRPGLRFVLTSRRLAKAAPNQALDHFGVTVDVGLVVEA